MRAAQVARAASTAREQTLVNANPRDGRTRTTLSRRMRIDLAHTLR
jgi:hypothetical protein